MTARTTREENLKYTSDMHIERRIGEGEGVQWVISHAMHVPSAPGAPLV